MDSGKDSQVWQYKWHIAIIIVVVGGGAGLIDLHEGLGDSRTVCGNS